MTELLHPLRRDGTAIDATFELTAVPTFEIVYHHKAGARGSPRSVNADYHEGLEAIFERLATVHASILSIEVDSSVARELPAADRELGLPFPIAIDRSTDIPQLRRNVTRAQKAIARRPGAKPGGGNDQKRIRMTVVLDSPASEKTKLEELLVRGA